MIDTRAIHLPDVRVTRDAGSLRIRCPYHPDVVRHMRYLGGRWDPATKTWVCDQRDAHRVARVLTETYGWTGSLPVEVTDILLALSDDDGHELVGDNPLWAFGRMIAERRGRDDRVRLGSGVVLVRGGFRHSAGSRRYPELGPLPGTVLEVRDVPTLLLDGSRNTPLARAVTELPERRRTLHPDGDTRTEKP